MSGLACDVAFIKSCITEIKASIGDQASIEELCDKVDVITENQTTIIETLDDMCADCPEELAAPFTVEQVVVDGDQTEKFAAGADVVLTDENGNKVGEGVVASSTYSEATMQTTVLLESATLNADVTAAQVKGVRLLAVKKAAVAERRVKVAEKKEAVAKGIAR
jgi:hypothetical protein